MHNHEDTDSTRPDLQDSGSSCAPQAEESVAETSADFSPDAAREGSAGIAADISSTSPISSGLTSEQPADLPAGSPTDFPDGPVSDSEIPWRGMPSLPSPEPPAVGVLQGGDEGCSSCPGCDMFSAEDMLEETELVLGLKLSQYGPVYFFRAGNENIRPGSKVLVETDQGVALGEVATARRLRVPLPKIRTDDGEEVEIKPITGLAGPEDIAAAADNRILAASARLYCKECIRERELDMKLVDVEVLHDRSKIIFYFTAPARIDFRELVKDLVRNYHTRIELRQIGVRHETQMIGAVGNCGMTCCCRRYLRKFAPVTIKMAKEQNLFLNPAKLSGICGRLLCCLAYEQENYEEFHKRSPKIGKRYSTTQGTMRVLRANLFRQSIFTLDENNEEREMQLDEWEALEPHRQDSLPDAHGERGEHRDQREHRERRPRRDDGRSRPRNHGSHDPAAGEEAQTQGRHQQRGERPEGGQPRSGQRPDSRHEQRPNHTDRPERADREDRTDRSDRAGRTDRADRYNSRDQRHTQERDQSSGYRDKRVDGAQHSHDAADDSAPQQERTERNERTDRGRHSRPDQRHEQHVEPHADQRHGNRDQRQRGADGNREWRDKRPEQAGSESRPAIDTNTMPEALPVTASAASSDVQANLASRNNERDLATGPVSAGLAFGADKPDFEAVQNIKPADTETGSDAHDESGPATSGADKSIFGLPGSRYAQNRGRGDRKPRPDRNRR
ncbi:hypothetical protein LJC48_06870 [Desulfovibrio sp. OttesenSCG-928-C06]|nr:hypothetical protein [Desulfovibrio sp. OttesenSCG-928-C06]